MRMSTAVAQAYARRRRRGRSACEQRGGSGQELFQHAGPLQRDRAVGDHADQHPGQSPMDLDPRRTQLGRQIGRLGRTEQQREPLSQRLGVGGHRERAELDRPVHSARCGRRRCCGRIDRLLRRRQCRWGRRGAGRRDREGDGAGVGCRPDPVASTSLTPGPCPVARERGGVGAAEGSGAGAARAICVVKMRWISTSPLPGPASPSRAAAAYDRSMTRSR